MHLQVEGYGFSLSLETLQGYLYSLRLVLRVYLLILQRHLLHFRILLNHALLCSLIAGIAFLSRVSLMPQVLQG